MVINLIDNSIRANYQGKFDCINTNIKHEVDKTIFPPSVLNNKKNIMDNRKFIEDLKTLLNSHFNNDVELLAKSIGIPEDQIYELLSGVNDPTHELVDKLKKYSPEKEENYFQFGSRVEINNSGDGYSQSFADMMSDKDREKYLKKENSDLHKLIKGKDELLKDKDELLSEKDKLISALQETIELLKNK